MSTTHGECPECGEWNAYTHQFCYFCGERLPWAQAPVKAPPKDPVAERAALQKELRERQRRQAVSDRRANIFVHFLHVIPSLFGAVLAVAMIWMVLAPAIAAPVPPACLWLIPPFFLILYFTTMKGTAFIVNFFRVLASI